MNWLRLYTDALHKRKVQSLPGELFKAWVNFLLIARQHDGYLTPIPDIAFELHVSDEVAESWLLALIHRGLFDRTMKGIRPHDWDEHQYESDSSTERVRKHRLKRGNPNHETLQKRSSNVIEQNRAEQSRTEVTPSGVTGKTPPLNPTEFEQARELLREYPGAEKLGTLPDDVIVEKCLRMAGSLTALAAGLRALYLTGKTPSLSWGWFPKVLESFLGLDQIDRRRA